MKRILSICLSIIFILALPSCKPNDGDSQWEFDYTIEKGVFTQGETIRITVEVTNIGKNYSYTGSPTDLFCPAKLYPEINENYMLDTLPFPNTDDATERIFARGQSAQYTYEFYTDNNSPNGAYTLEVPFASHTETFKRLLFIESPMTEEELAVIELANAEILKKYPIDSLDNYRVRIDQNKKGEFFVRYDLMIGNYKTYETYNVNFNADKTIETIYGDYGEYAAYLPYATEDKIREAEEKLTKQLEQYDSHSGFYLSIDFEGYLCLNAEVIIKFENIFNSGGCGIDHEHKFFKERICSLP